MSNFKGPKRIILSGEDGEHKQTIEITDTYPERFEDVYSYSGKVPTSVIRLPRYVALETEDIEQHKILIYLIHRIASIHMHNHNAKREDDVIDEITAYITTISHFGTDAVIDYVTNTKHCHVFEHLTNVLRLYCYNGYHDPHPDINGVDILRNYPGKLYKSEISF